MMHIGKNSIEAEEKTLYKIAMFGDFPNVQISLVKTGWRGDFDYKRVENFANKFGNIQHSSLHADWKKRFYQHSHYLKKYDVELKHENEIKVIKDGEEKMKDVSDTAIAFYCCRVLMLDPSINLVILITGDGDFIPVVKGIKDLRNIPVYIISVSHSLNSALREFADKIFYYKDIIYPK